MSGKFEKTDNYVLDKINTLLKEKNMSHYRLAKNSGLLLSSLSVMLSRGSTPNFITLDKICHGFGITTAQFFNYDDEQVILTKKQKEFLNPWTQLYDNEKLKLKAYMQAITDYNSTHQKKN
ncbi:MAG: helix-turn-helix domain-containing protein [Phascolarctobacterium sp.]|nr:helix-turn-helix domain-containing protein [Phascolarctobacterium sp.]